MSDETEKPEIVEQFESCVDSKRIVPLNKTLLGFFGQEVTDEESWEKHWKAMPRFAFTQENLPAKELLIKFSSEEDLQAFAKLIGQKLTMKTKSVWYPEKETSATQDLKRWISEDNVEQFKENPDYYDKN